MGGREERRSINWIITPSTEALLSCFAPSSSDENKMIDQESDSLVDMSLPKRRVQECDEGSHSRPAASPDSAAGGMGKDQWAVKI